MNTRALGPTFAGGMQPIVEDGYELIYYPDVNNHQLQQEGKNPVFYWMPNYVHIARKNGEEDGDLMFNLIRFAGVQSADTTVGATEDREVAGGVLSFTATSAPPDRVLEESQEQIKALFEGKDDHFWGIRSSREPVFRPVPIVTNVTSVSNLSPMADGTVPAVEGPGQEPAPGAPGGGGPAPSRSSIRGAVNQSRTHREYQRRTIPFSELARVKTRSEIDPWFWQMQGTGNGSIDPTGQNAYVALVGAYPTAILYESFHGSYSPVFVQNALQMKFWTPEMELTIKGDWEKVFSHFSAHASGKSFWFSGDIKAELNNLRISGGITVDIKIDETLPNADKLREYIEKKTDLVYQKFMEQAKSVIFTPAPEVEAAEAESGKGSSLFGFGGGFALKYRQDRASLQLHYHETRQLAYLQDHVISSSLEGMHDEIQADPSAEGKYFQTIYLDDWPRKISRITKPIGLGSDAVAFMSAQIGYPNTAGELMWTGRPFQKSDPDDYSWKIGITQKFAEDVDNPPADWAPDVTFVKRAIHMNEEPDAFDSPFHRIQMDDNIIHLDEGPSGTPLNDITLEVRADDAVRLAVGPINLGVELENSRQIVEVTFRSTDEDENVIERFEPIKFSFNNEDQNQNRFWTIYSSAQDVGAYFDYQIRVIVKGSLFTKGMEWIGPWTPMTGNGPLMLSVPTPEDEGVTTVRSFPLAGTAADDTDAPSAPPSSNEDSSAPPSSDENAGGNPNPPAPITREEELEVSGYGYEAEEDTPSDSTRSMVPPSGNARSTSKNGVHTLDSAY